VDVAAAIADPVRREILTRLRDGPLPAGAIASRFAISRPAVSRHLRVLRDAGLIEEQRPEADRRVRVYTLRAEPVEELAGWLDAVSRGWQSRLESFKDYVAVRAR
jgi:DNA-binding transcriptional ArsR family regulator